MEWNVRPWKLGLYRLVDSSASFSVFRFFPSSPRRYIINAMIKMLITATPPKTAPTTAPVGKEVPESAEGVAVDVESDRKTSALSGLSLSLAG